MEQNLNLYYSSGSDSPIEFEMFDSHIYVDHLQALKNQIDSFTELEANWDGYDGVALLETISTKAKQFIALLDDIYIDKITDLYPNTHGTITIDWDNEKGEKLSLEIGENNHSYFIDKIDSKPSFFNAQDLPNLEEFSSHLCEIFKDELPRLSFF
jgi:hypothetical protein